MHPHLLPAVALVCLTVAPAQGPCPLQLVPTGQGIPGTDYVVTCATTWDPDGSGPQLPRLVLGGSFGLAGDRLAQRVAAFEPASRQWQAMGSLSQSVAALAVLPNGTLVAGGSFQSGTECLMQWNGAAWLPFGSGGNPPGSVACLAVAANGDLVAVVREYIGSAFVSTVHRLTGTGWQSLGAAAGPFYPELFALVALPNGDLVASGRMQTMGGVAAAGVARWDGSAWAPLGTGTTGFVSALAVLPGGDLVVGGGFDTIGGVAAANVARWNGTAWSALGSGTSTSVTTGSVTVRAFLVLPNGDLVAGGHFDTAGGVPARKVARWNGTAWSALGAGIQPDPPSGSASFIAVYCLHPSPDGSLVAGGYFQTAGGRDAPYVARFDGSAWGPLRASGIGQPARVVAYTAAGELVLAGGFREIDGVVVNGIAVWNGSAWAALGAGLSGPGEDAAVVHEVLVRGNGEVVVGGDFVSAGDVAVAGIALWDGAAWQSLGSGLAGGAGARPVVRALAEAPNGELLVAGDFASAGGVPAPNIARWNGVGWSALGAGLAGTAVNHVAVLAGGDLLAVWGAGAMMRWDGVTWQPIGTAGNVGFGSNWNVLALLALPDGSALVGGDFTRMSGLDMFRVSRWAGGVWSAVGGGIGSHSSYEVVRSLGVLPDGDVVAGGSGLQVGGGPSNAMIRLDGGVWSSVANVAVPCEDMAIGESGEIAVAGGFLVAGGMVSAYLARVVVTCPAVVVAGGAGCAGSGGVNVLAARGLPWVGTVWRAEATGMPAGGLGLAVYGFGVAATPLSAVVPQGGPGCMLLVTPDLVVARVVGSGMVVTELAIPESVALAGLVVHHQVGAVEFGGGGMVVAVTSTNRLTITVGAW